MPKEALLNGLQLFIKFLQECFVLDYYQAVKCSIITYVRLRMKYCAVAVLFWLDLYFSVCGQKYESLSVTIYESLYFHHLTVGPFGM